MPKSLRHGSVLLGAAAVSFLLSAAPAGAQSSGASLSERVAEARNQQVAAASVAAGSAPVCEAVPTQNVRTGGHRGIFPDCTYAYEDGHPSIRITDRPDHGNLNVYTEGGYFYYVPDAGYAGADTVKFAMANTAGESAELTVNFEISPTTNSAPQCYHVEGQVYTPEGETVLLGHLLNRIGTSRTASAYCYDPEGDAVTLDIVTAPAAGSLVNSAPTEYGEPTVTYTHASGALAGDKVEAVVRPRDEHGLVGPDVQIGFEVQAADYNTAPTCYPSSVDPVYHQSVEQGVATPVWDAWCWDDEGDAITYTPLTQPENASVTASQFGLTMTPSAATGTTSFTYRGSDALGGQSDPQTVTVNLVPKHVDPTCADLTVAVAAATRTEGDAVCSDADGDTVHVAVTPENHEAIAWTRHGDLEIRRFSEGKLRFAYTPDAGFSGTDTFMVVPGDQFGHSTGGKVTLNVAGSGTSGTGTTTTPPPAPTPTAPVVTPEQAKAAMTTLLSNETVEFLRDVSKLNRKGIDARKPVLSIGTVGAEQLPNGGTAKFGVYDKPAARKAAASARRKSLGSTRVTLAKGQKKAVKIKLNAKGKSLLRKKGKVKLTVDATFTDALTGATVKKSRTYTFKVKKKRR